MKAKNFYHLCSDGAFAKNLIITKDDAFAAFNLIGVAVFGSNVIVVAFSIEDTHFHFLLYGSFEECSKFMKLLGTSYKKHVAAKRGTLDGIKLDWTLYEIEDESYLMNVGTYVVNQATKDGKRVMPYDYLLGTGSMYFRRDNHISIWSLSKHGAVSEIKRIGELPKRRRADYLHSTLGVPDDWKICNGYLLPENYVDVERFENIYKSFNCYRAFLSSGRVKDDPISTRLAKERGVTMEDSEIREPCGDICERLFGIRDIRYLSSVQRITLALEIRKTLNLSKRQISSVVRLPLAEIEKYVR